VKLCHRFGSCGISAQRRKSASILPRPATSVVDLGAYNTEPSDYPDFAEKVGLALQRGDANRAGFLSAGSGVGVCVAANKIPGIRAGMCHDTYSAPRAWSTTT